MTFFTVTDMATGNTVHLYPGHVFYCRINQQLGATVIVSTGGAYVPCKEPLDEVLKKWQDALTTKEEAPKETGTNPGNQVGNNIGGQ